MKKLKGFLRALKAKPLFAGAFESREDVFGLFQKNEDKDIIICYAQYEQCEYDGSASVLYYRKSTRKYYEAYGSHCSCYGLEDQWDRDEEMNMIELQKRIADRHFRDGDIFKEAFGKFKEQ